MKVPISRILANPEHHQTLKYLLSARGKHNDALICMFGG